MRLRELIDGITVHDFQGESDVEISGIAYDSRSVAPGSLFVAVKGHTQDGHDFIRDAVSRGAAAVVSQHPLSPIGKGKANQIAMIQVQDSREALSRIAVRFFKTPFKAMNLIGITGTNGKTTTAYLLESILMAAGRRPGVIGTINYRFSGHTQEAPVTTPESLDLMRTLRSMADSAVSDVVMEVSSHSLDQGRVRDCPFHVAIFTNISRDHLDYHGSMEAYFEAKARLFRSFPKSGAGGPAHAVINADDAKGRELINLTDARVTTYGKGRTCDVRAHSVRVSQTGLTARLITPQGEADIVSPLHGTFDIYNIMAATGGALAIGIDLESICSGLSRLKGVPGRMEWVKNRRGLALIVDYAHTPDALLKALEAVRSLTKGRVITVFGCGGDRDRGKRGEMGRVAGIRSDKVFITSDNPRTEDPAAIAGQIEAGVIESGVKEYVLELDRKKAIQRAVKTAHNKDLVLIAGKGHEDYQIIGSEKRAFDDRLVAAEAANDM
ncbi:MAG: UDP-N-acetylmuramoyl-L-alanyl-D-glutamate--2,6-diaminopimelate ligase [Deltaproteobacteria bacterium]|nr:UDP-N-acetylmuramoyl-L-alanyl-D-glutamate--2,6-diaminopimelate ligase [Deltaproteobacteria bacterium]